ncbi:MAG: response regulator [Chitinophagaceae bacterium]
MISKRGKPSIALIDDHEVVRKAIRSLIGAFNEFTVLFDVGTFNELTAQLAERKIPDILLMDIRMPDKTGFEVASWMKENKPQVKVLAFSSESDGFSIAKVMRSGAKGFVSKGANPTELLLAINTVLRGDAYLSQTDFNNFSEAIQNSNDYFKNTNTVEFNAKEKAFIKLACTSLSYKEIAEKLIVGTRSVEDYRMQVFQKLGIHTRQELAVYAVQNKLL